MFSQLHITACAVRFAIHRLAPASVLIVIALAFATSAVNAQSNHSIRFDGTDSWLDLGSRTGFDFRSCFTLEAWIRPASFHDTTGIVGNYHRDQYGGSGYGLVLDSSGRLGLVLAHDLGTTDFVWSNQSIALDEWAHVAGNWDGRTLRVYIDGFEDARADVPGLGVIWVIDNSMTVARYVENPNGFFKGHIDEVRMWNVCRSAAELRNTQHLRLESGMPGQVSYLRMDEGDGAITADAVGSGRIATLRGSCAWEQSDVSLGVGTTAQSAPSTPTRSHYFNGTDVRVDYRKPSLARPLLITSLLDQTEEAVPMDVHRMAPRAWIIRPNGDTFNVKMTFTLGRGAISQGDASTPENLHLFYQPANYRDRWERVADAISVDTVFGSVTFDSVIAGPNGIDDAGGRFVVGSTGDSRLDSPRELEIVNDLADRQLCAYDPATLSVLADGRNLRYAWKRNGVAIQTAVGPTLSINRVTVDDDGVYQVTIVDQSGSIVASREARLRVTVAPRIIADPTDVRVVEGQSFDLYSELEGTDVQYQWQRNRVDIPGETRHNIVFAPVDTNDAGYYRLIVRNECGEDVTADAHVSVTAKPKTSGVADPSIARDFSITASPNPAREQITVSIRGPLDARVPIVLVNSRGVVVASAAPTIGSDGTARASFDVSVLASGIYLIRAHAHGHAVASTRVVVAR